MSEEFYKWDKKFNTGIVWIDKQHKKLLEKINILVNAVIKREYRKEIESTIQFLEVYTKTHFSTEEKFMKKYK